MLFDEFPVLRDLWKGKKWVRTGRQWAYRADLGNTRIAESNMRMKQIGANKYLCTYDAQLVVLALQKLTLTFASFSISSNLWEALFAKKNRDIWVSSCLTAQINVSMKKACNEREVTPTTGWNHGPRMHMTARGTRRKHTCLYWFYDFMKI